MTAEPKGWWDSVPKSIPEAKAAWRRFYEGAKNNLDPIEQIDKALKAEGIQTDINHLARLTRGLAGRVKLQIKYGTIDINTRDVNGKGLDEILKPVNNSPDHFKIYAVSKRVVELEGRGIKTGFDLAHANENVAKHAAKFEPVFRELVGFQNRILDNMVKSGMLNADMAAKMKKMNNDYVPFYRLMDPNSALGKELGLRGDLAVRNAIYQIKGSGREVFDPIDSIIKNTYLFTDLAERNRALLELKRGNDLAPDNLKFLEKDKNLRPIEVTPAEIQKWMDTHGIEGFADDAMTIFRPNVFNPEAGKIRIFENGKPVVYKTTDALTRAVNGLDREATGALLRIFGAPARWVRAGSVLAPEFMLRNPIRDMLSAMVQTKYGFYPIVDHISALGSMFNKDQHFKNWMADGGANSNLVSLDQKLIQTDPRKTLKNVPGAVLNPKNWLEMLQAASQMTEDVTRLGVYKRAIKGGASRTEAGYEAREGGLDFARHGSSGAVKSLNAVIPFFNAQLEGMDRITRAFRDRPLQTSLRVGAGITLPSVLQWFNNKDDERVREVPRWQKDIAWIVATNNWVPVPENMVGKVPKTAEAAAGLKNTFRQGPDGQWQYNNGTIYRIPKPFELGVIFGSIPERILDAYYGQHPDAFKDLHKSITQALGPLGVLANPQQGLESYLPQVVKPMVEQFANRSFFMDEKLVNPVMEKKSPELHQTRQTSETAKLLGEGIRNVVGDRNWLGSPIIIDNYIRQYTGGLGKYVTNAIDAAIKGVSEGPDAPVSPEMEAADIPGYKAFAVRYPGSSAQSVKDFYNTRGERLQDKANLQGLKGTELQAAKLKQSHTGYDGKPVYDQLRAGFGTINRIRDDKKMSAEEKRTAMDLTYLFMIEAAKRGNAQFERTQRKAP